MCCELFLHSIISRFYARSNTNKSNGVKDIIFSICGCFFFSRINLFLLFFLSFSWFLFCSLCDLLIYNTATNKKRIYRIENQHFLAFVKDESNEQEKKKKTPLTENICICFRWNRTIWSASIAYAEALQQSCPYMCDSTQLHRA